MKIDNKIFAIIEEAVAKAREFLALTGAQMKVKVFKLEVMIIDFDGIGEEQVKSALENARFPNRCISPKVKGIDFREVEWSDGHPLNRRDTCDVAYKDLFLKFK